VLLLGEPSCFPVKTPRIEGCRAGVAYNFLENSQRLVERYAVIFSAVAAAMLMASLFAKSAFERIVNSIPPPAIP